MRITLRIFTTLAAIAISVTAADKAIPLPAIGPSAGVSGSLANEARAAIDRGMKWLVAKQDEQGHWSSPDFPALTALPLWALARGNSGDQAAMDKAVTYILSCARDDGAICREPAEARKGGGLCNYNTALCMVALHETGRADLVPFVQKARVFVAGTQHLGDDIYRGGMGYDEETGRPYADLSNSYIAYEAMKLTERVEDLRTATEQRADLDWAAARQFVSRIQNLPGHNDQPWASDAPEEKGGFAYKPDSSMAGSVTNEDGSIRLRSYGSMTYAGLLSFIYADVDKTDPRVASAYEWASKQWNLDENPGMGLQGLYYYYNVLAKGLAAYGSDLVPLPDGGQVNWREALIRKLVSLQKIEPDGTGYWVNSEGRWWEADPTLVTSYSLLALEIALGL